MFGSEQTSWRIVARERTLGSNATSCKEATWASTEGSDLIPRTSIG
jgi:hypothetical protein